MQNKTLGASIIIAGTSIGAGMLALPIAVHNVGILYGISAIIIMMLFSGYGAYLISKACVFYPKAESLHGLATAFLNKFGGKIILIATLFLYWSLCSAYISGVSSKIVSHLNIENLSAFSSYAVSLMIAIFMGICLIIGTQIIDNLNRFAFFIMIACLVFIIIMLSTNITISNIALGHTPSMLHFLAILPLIFTSFGYHIVVPSISSYVNHEDKKINNALMAGNLTPAIVYLMWVIVVLGSIPNSTMQTIAISNNSVGALTGVINKLINSKLFEVANSGFYILAMLTSFFGVSLGLRDYLTEVFNLKHNLNGKIQAATLTLLIPLIISIFIPSFVKALGLAAVPLAILAIFAPIVVILNIYKQQQKSISAFSKLLMIIVSLLGIIVIVTQIAIVLGFMPSIS
jgi:tyrosine-specific transport protein